MPGAEMPKLRFVHLTHHCFPSTQAGPQHTLVKAATTLDQTTACSVLSGDICLPHPHRSP